MPSAKKVVSASAAPSGQKPSRFPTNHRYGLVCNSQNPEGRLSGIADLVTRAVDSTRSFLRPFGTDLAIGGLLRVPGRRN